MASPQTMQTPPTSTPANEPLIFTMPEKYRGAAVTQAAPTPVPVPTPKPVPPPPPPPPPKPAPKPVVPGAKKKGMARSTKILLVVGGLLLLLLGAAAVYVYVTTQTPAVAPIEKPPVVIPPPDETPPDETPPDETPPDETPPDPLFPQALKPGRDSDSDGLTDIEEALYGSNPGLPDSDADGYNDGNEVFHRYHPSGGAPGTLLESGIVREYVAATYSILYPATWSANATDERVQFTAPSGEVVAVMTVSEKDPLMNLSAWAETDSVASKLNLLPNTSKNGYPILVTADQMSTYLDLGSSVMSITYVIPVKNTIDYLQTYQMMVNSLRAL